VYGYEENQAESSVPEDTADAGDRAVGQPSPCPHRRLLDKQDIGKPISDLYPHLKGFCDLPLIDADDPKRPDDFDVVFSQRRTAWSERSRLLARQGR